MEEEITPEHVELKVINSKTYRGLRPLFIVVFLLSYFLSFVYSFPLWIIIIMVVLNIAIPIIMGIYSKNFRREGFVSIDLKNIVVSQKDKQPIVVPIASVEKLKISRGSTHHRDNDIYAPETHNNWITFSFNKKFYELEFCIANAGENERFEKVVNKLRGLYSNLYYESI